MKKYLNNSFSFSFFGALVILVLFTSLKPEKKAAFVQDSYTDSSSVILVKNINGPILGYSKTSGVNILIINGFSFKDLNKNGKLEKYEDWRLSVDERAKDLASQMSVEQIAGLMLYSGHQAIPAGAGAFMGGTYNGKKFTDGGIDPSDITDQQNKFLIKDNLRHVLITSVQSPEVAAKWNNKVQSLVEGSGLGIPANNSSDPRNAINIGLEYTAGAGGKISQWPDELGLAATFDPAIVQQFGNIAGQEYRALGITTALSPQIDLGSEPRWSRINGTFGEDPQLAADLARAYVDGFQTSTGTSEIKDGWGYHSVNAMIKHWPGGGPEEGGRDAHFAYGKYAVYPGNNFDEHLIPFVNGGLHLSGKTKMASAVMPYYTISYNIDNKNGENEGNSYNSYLITDLLRNKYGYQGVVCTDWAVTGDEGKTPDIFGGKPWGMEKKTVVERHYKILMAGVDQFGGNNDAGPIIEAYKMGVAEHGVTFMRKRFEQSAVRLLLNIFRTGLFENPYLNVENSVETVGKPEFMTAGYSAQLKSVIMLKNTGILPLKKGITIYMPKKYTAASQGFFGPPSKEKYEDAINPALLNKYFSITDDPTKADCAVVFISSPTSGAGYDAVDVKNGGSGYVPISLQYNPYIAVDARVHSLAAGDPAEPNVLDRTYKGKSITSGNLQDLKTIQETKSLMKGKPVVVVVAANKPFVPEEIEKDANAILLSFGVQNQAILDILSGAAEPTGLLPLQLPANMKTVEQQNEDIPHDMVCYTDASNNIYDFGFGMNWKGVINDVRTKNYVKRISNPIITVKGNMVMISNATAKAKIYYTTNGSTPAFVKENEYFGPFKASKGITVKAIAKQYGINNSSLVVYNVK